MPAHTARAAILLMLAASAIFAATMLIAKLLGHGGLSPFQVSGGRFVFALATLLVVIAARPEMRAGFAGAQWGLHLLRVVCGWGGVTCMFAAAARMPLSDAMAISFLNPLVAMGLAVMVLGDHLTPRKILAAGLGLFGAVVLLRPGMGAFQPAALLALAAAVLTGIEISVIKRLSDREPPMRILLINNLIGACMAAVAAALVWRAPDGAQWALLVVIGVLMVCGQALFIQAMKRGEASFVTPAIYAVLVFAALFDGLWFGVWPDWVGVAGAALIVSGALVLAVAPGGTGSERAPKEKNAANRAAPGRGV